MIDLSSHWEVLLAPLAGAIAWLWMRQREHGRDHRSDLESDNDRLREVIEGLRTELSRLRTEFADLSGRFNLLEAQKLEAEAMLEQISGRKVGEITFAELLAESRSRYDERMMLKKLVRAWGGIGLLWVKEHDPVRQVFRMIAVSDAYARTYLSQPAEVYDGKLDSEIWDAETAAAFYQNDLEAIKSGRRISVRETVQSSLSGAAGQFNGAKWAFVTPLGLQTVWGFGMHTHVPAELG